MSSFDMSIMNQSNLSRQNSTMMDNNMSIIRYSDSISKRGNNKSFFDRKLIQFPLMQPDYFERTLLFEQYMEN